jgi:threonine/homoserine/homoserine lactone efflux protein
MDFNVWLAFTITELALSFTPGPAVLLVSSQGLKYGVRASNFGAFGISTANLIYFTLSALGLSAIILEAKDLFDVIKIAGACYLIFLGIKGVYYSLVKTDSKQKSESVAITVKNSHTFLQAFVTQLSNPKAIIFFASLLPQFVNPHENIIFQMSIFALTTIGTETFILMGYGWLGAKGRDTVHQNPKIMKWVDRLAGTILIAIGVNLFLTKR